MKKKITLVMALCIALCGLAGCSGSNNAESTATPVAETAATTAATEAETATTTAATEAETTTTTATEEEEAPAAEGTVIYDANDIKITAGEFTTCKEYDDEPCLALDIVNKTGKELTLYKLPMSVGGWMFDLYCLTVSEDGYVNMDGTFTIPAGNDTNKYYMHVGNYLLNKHGFTEIPDIEFMYDKDGVKIVMQGETYDADYWGPQIKLYASNSTDKTVFIRIPETTLDGTAFDTYGDMIIAPGKRESEEVAFAFIDDLGRSMTEVEPVSEITMKFDIYEYDQRGDNILLDSAKPVTVTYDASTVEKVSASSGGHAEEQLSEEELAALKGWWTREGVFADNDTATVAIDFITWNGNTWYISGNFGGTDYWGGNAELTEKGLVGTMKTATLGADGNYTEGEPVEVMVTEEGDNGVLLSYGAEKEYHLVFKSE